MVSNYWVDKNVFLLGGGNLIGTHLAKALLPIARSVIVADNWSSGNVKNVPSGVVPWGIDLRNYEDVKELLSYKDHKIVFHLAAQHGGRGYVASHAVELYNNLELDTTIFRACANAGVEKVIFSSSACAYPIDLQTNSNEVIYLSEDLIDYNNMRQADGPYGTEKLIGEAMLDAYIAQGAFKGCSTRSFTVYGPLMNESHAIAALIAKAYIRQEPYEIWGSRLTPPIRNWTYVEDNVTGALLAAEYLDRGAINIGIEERFTPEHAAKLIFEYFGWYPREIEFQSNKPTGPLNRIANASKLKSLGWFPQYNFWTGLEKTVEWYTSTHNVEELRQTLERKLTER